MTLYLITIRGTLTGLYKARIETEAGALVGQALNLNRQAAERRAIWQAERYGKDRNWGQLRIIKRQPPSAGAVPA